MYPGGQGKKKHNNQNNNFEAPVSRGKRGTTKRDANPYFFNNKKNKIKPCIFSIDYIKWVLSKNIHRDNVVLGASWAGFRNDYCILVSKRFPIASVENCCLATTWSFVYKQNIEASQVLTLPMVKSCVQRTWRPSWGGHEMVAKQTHPNIHTRRKLPKMNQREKSRTKRKGAWFFSLSVGIH